MKGENLNMNKLLQKLAKIFLGLSMAAGVGVSIGTGKKNVTSANAATATITFTSASAASSGNFTATPAKSNGSSAPAWMDSKCRLYANNTLTVTSSSETITQLTFNWTKTSNKAFATATANVGSYSHPSGAGTGTWTGSATTIVFTVGSSGQLNLTTVGVTYTAGGTNYTVYFNNNTGSGTMSNDTTTGSSYIAPSCTFTKTDYVFTKWALGSTSGTQYSPGETISNISGNITLYAIWVDPSIWTKDTFTVTDLGGGASYEAFSVTGTSGATYVGYCMKNNSNIQFNTYSSPKNRSIATSVSAGKIRMVSVTWGDANSKEFTIYCGDSPYANNSTGATGTAQTSKLSSSNTTVVINGDYDYVSLYPNGAIYPASVSFYWELPNELSSIVLSGQTTSFDSGDTFSFGGTVTAKYTKNSDANVTSQTTFHLDSASGTNMSGVTLSHALHDGHTIYAKYTEDDITKTATYSISVANAPVSSLTLASNTGKVATTELFDMSEIGVTILPADAVQTYEWTVLSNTVSNDYTFEANIVEAGNTEGTITLKCTSTADSSKYQTFVLTVSGNPVVTLPNSVTLYTGKTTTVTASVEGGTSPYSYSWSITSGGSNASISSGGSSATVTLSGSAAGSVTLQCSVTDSNSKSDSASVTFTVTASAVTEVNWSASAFDVFSGATIPANIDDTWEVNYEKNNGDADYITFGDYELYLGEDLIDELPYTFVGADNGKELHVEYGGISSSSVAVTVTQRINDVMASSTSSWDYTFPSKQWSAAGSVTLDGKSWTMSGTDDGSPYFGWDDTKGQQFGSGSHPWSDISLQSSAFSGTVDSVTVYTSGASSINATVQVSVGGTAYGSAQTITNANTAYTFDLGGKSGTISIDWVNSSSKAIYIKEIVVNTASSSSNIANSEDHKAAQRVAVKFANAFNVAMATTSNCTTNMSTAWSTCSTAYNTFKSEASALGSTEEAWAKNLVKYATRQYSDDSGEACLERMMKTYEVCVQKHGQTAFMSELVTLGAPQVSPLINVIGENTNTIAIIVIISMVSVGAIGGYFFIRKRKENI